MRPGVERRVDAPAWGGSSSTTNFLIDDGVYLIANYDHLATVDKRSAAVCSCTDTLEGDLGERGLVISAPIELSGNSLHVKIAQIDPQELKSYLLFWDKLNWPSNNIVMIDGDPDIAFLQQAGILERDHIRLMEGGEMASLFLKAHLSAFRRLDATEPGKWSLARGANSLSFQGDDLISGNGVSFTLTNAIPVPDKDVPLNEILEFKAKRADELAALRLHLDAIGTGLSRNNLNADNIRQRAAELETSIVDYVKSARETKFPFRLTKIETKIDYSKFLIGSAIWYLAATHIQLPSVITILGGLYASIEIKQSVGLRDRPSAASPFEYVTSYYNRVF